MNGQAPNYISNLIHMYCMTASMYGLHSNSELLFVLPSMKVKKTLGDRAFSAAASSLENY